MHRSLLFFTGEFCASCRRMKEEGTLDILAEEFDVDVVREIDAAAEPEDVQKYGVTALPTIVFLVNGKRVCQFSGYRSVERCKEIIREALGRVCDD